MKKLFTLFPILAFTIFTQAQTSSFQVLDEDNGNALVTNGQAFYQSTTPNGTDYTKHFEIKNVSTNTIVIRVRKDEIQINEVTPSDKAEAYFCFDTYCYIPSIISATEALAPGGSFKFYPKFDEASQVGQSTVGYEVSDMGNPSDIINIELRYNNPLSIKKASNWMLNASSVYPNPATSMAKIDVISNTSLNDVNVDVMNVLGTKVSSTKTNFHAGKNSVAISTDDFSAGIYFMVVKHNDKSIVRKFTVSK